jgi:hypothetical protein
MTILDRRGIPKKVLYGKVPKYRSVFLLYRARMVQELFALMHKAFWIKAEGQTDDSGIEWAELKPKTIKYKMTLEGSGPLGGYNVNREWYDSDQSAESARKTGPANHRILDREQQSIYNSIYQSAIKRTRNAAKAKAEALKAAIASSPERGFASLIGVRTGRLAASTYPGTVVNNRYYPTVDQEFEITEKVIEFGNDKVPYSKEFEEGHDKVPPRPILPDDLTPWIVQCHEKIIDEVKAVYVTKQIVANNNKQLAKPSSRKRANTGTTKRTGKRATKRKATKRSRPKTS